VGTLLALLVFFALFGIFLTQYLPLWMTDNEAAFTGKTQASMADLKSNMDLQLVLGGPSAFSTPFVMSSDGVPLLAQPTGGNLNFLPVQSGVFANVSMTVGPGGSSATYRNFTLGTLSMSIPNRYYSPQVFELEDDAVVQAQNDLQQIVAFPPLLAVNTTGTQIGVQLVLVQLFGNASQAISTGTTEVSSHYLYTQKLTSTGVGGGATFNGEFKLGTHFPCAWRTFLSSALNASGVAASHFALTPTGCIPSNGVAKIVDLKFLNINSLTLIIGAFSLVMGVGVE